MILIPTAIQGWQSRLYQFFVLPNAEGERKAVRRKTFRLNAQSFIAPNREGERKYARRKTIRSNAQMLYIMVYTYTGWGWGLGGDSQWPMDDEICLRSNRNHIPNLVKHCTGPLPLAHVIAPIAYLPTVWRDYMHVCTQYYYTLP